PSYLLCPEVYTWHLLDDTTRAELSAEKYNRLNKSAGGKSVIESAVNAGILFKNTRMTNLIYSSINGRGDSEEIQEYANLVGEIDDQLDVISVDYVTCSYYRTVTAPRPQNRMPLHFCLDSEMSQLSLGASSPKHSNNVHLPSNPIRNDNSIVTISHSLPQVTA
ncbi:unnamed protein product, partial [Allacma fusca]